MERLCQCKSKKQGAIEGLRSPILTFAFGGFLFFDPLGRPLIFVRDSVVRGGEGDWGGDWGEDCIFLEPLGRPLRSFSAFSNFAFRISFFTSRSLLVASLNFAMFSLLFSVSLSGSSASIFLYTTDCVGEKPQSVRKDDPPPPPGPFVRRRRRALARVRVGLRRTALRAAFDRIIIVVVISFVVPFVISIVVLIVVDGGEALLVLVLFVVSTTTTRPG